jgi:serine/threonine protein kinase
MAFCCIHHHYNQDGRLRCTECNSLLAGAQVGDYTIIGYLGRGSSSIVYAASQHSLHQRRVVMKVFQPLEEQMTMSGFRREAQMLASLVHPYILPLYGYGVIDERRADPGDTLIYSPYLVFPYAEQGSLEDLFMQEGRQPWSLERVIPIIEEAADALNYAHVRGVVHRDVKPANLLMIGSHTVLSDFGLASLIAAEQSHLNAPWAGSPAYMAPEVWTLRPGRYSDQYALAVTCYRLLTGRFPWTVVEGSVLNWSHLHRYVAPRPLRDYRPDLPLAVGIVLARALAKGPHERYATVKAFADDLRLAAKDDTQVILTTTAVLVSKNRVQASDADAQRAETRAPALPAPQTVVVSPAVMAQERNQKTTRLGHFVRTHTLSRLPVTSVQPHEDADLIQWHLELVSTTEILKRTAGDRWTWNGLLLNGLLYAIMVLFTAIYVNVGSAEHLALYLLPALLIGPMVARCFRAFLLLSYIWGLLVGMMFGIADTLFSGLACYGWTILLLVLPHWGQDWQHLPIYIQTASALEGRALFLMLLSLWSTVLGGAIIGLWAVRTEVRRKARLSM